MREITPKFKVSDEFHIDEHHLNWVEAQEIRDRMIDKNIEIFGPRKISDYIIIPNAEGEEE
jgi:hypothetical protein